MRLPNQTAFRLIWGPSSVEQSVWRSVRLRNLVQEADHAGDPATLQRDDVAALDRSLAAGWAKTPRKSQMIAVALGLAQQGEAEIGEALVDAADIGADLARAGRLGQGIDVGGVGRPLLAQQPGAPAGVRFVPQRNV